MDMEGDIKGLQLLHDPDWKKHLPEIAGSMIGLAAFNGIYLDVRLHPMIYRLLVQKSSSTIFEDLRAVHPTLHRSLEDLRKCDVEGLGLTWSVWLPGCNSNVDLSSSSSGYNSSGGCNAEGAPPVRQSDVEQFVQAYARTVLVGAVEDRLNTFMKAAVKCMDVGAAYSLLTAGDLELLICGLPDAGDFQLLEKSCSYENGYCSDAPTVQHFWQVVHGMSEIWKRKFLLFCTGCDRVPILGLEALRFVIARSAADLDHLPTANTCINQLNLPMYSSVEMTRDRLYRSLVYDVGFGFA